MKKIMYSMIVVIATICFMGSIAMAGQPIPKIVGLCIPESGTDKGWNEQAKVCIEKTAKKYGFKVILAEGLGYRDIKPTLRDMVGKGCELIITHAAGYAISGAEISQETGVKMVLAEGGDKNIVQGRVSDIRSKSGPGGFLAGVLAARMTRTNLVGVVTSAESGTACRVISGFVQGLKAAKPSCKFIYSLIGESAYADAAGAKRNADDQIAVGVDVIFGHGDGASFGMLQSCSSNKAKDGGKVWFIDLIGDKRSIDKADVLLSSVVFDFSVVYDHIIEDIVNGTFGKVYYVAVPDGGIHILKPNKAVPKLVLDEIEAVRKKIANGEIQVVDIPIPTDMHKFLDKTYPKK